MNTEKEVERYEFKKPNPIKGYPELYWRGKRPFTSTQYYPAQLKERYGEEDENGWINKIFWGDNLQVMSHMLKEYRGKIDLIYIDPPFDSKADYKKKIKLKGKQVNSDINSFEEKQYSDIWVNDEYLQFMYERLILMRELLSDTGSIYVHCDWHKSHYIRCLMDEIFGVNNFRNEITWKTQTSSGMKVNANKLGQNHDTIFLYTKTDKYTFNKVFMPVSEEYINKVFTQKDKKGRFKTGELQEPSKETLIKLKEEDKLYETSGGKLRYKIYADDFEGILVDDVWIDFKSLSSNSSERTNYPTQKPEKLIERIINLSSKPGDLVFDCFMGSGTTQVVSMKLGRRFLGSDINLGAIQTTCKRLYNAINKIENKGRLFTEFEIYNVNNYDVFRNPIEAKELLIDIFDIQSLGRSHIYDGELNGRMVKIMPINRISTRADLKELIAGLPYKEFEKREKEHANAPVEKITLVCMGHEPDLKGYLQSQVDYKLDIEIVDILRDNTKLQFKRDSEAKIIIDDDLLVIHKFYPRNLLQKVSILDEDIEDWRQLVESVIVDFNYDGAVIEPTIVDIPDKNELVKGKYKIPKDAGVIKVKITDVLSETFEWEGVYEYGKEIGIESLRSV